MLVCHWYSFTRGPLKHLPNCVAWVTWCDFFFIDLYHYSSQSIYLIPWFWIDKLDKHHKCRLQILWFHFQKYQSFLWFLVQKMILSTFRHDESSSGTRVFGQIGLKRLTKLVLMVKNILLHWCKCAKGSSFVARFLWKHGIDKWENHKDKLFFINCFLFHSSLKCNVLN